MFDIIKPIPWVDAAIPWALSSVLLFYLGGTLGWTLGMLRNVKTKLPPGHRITPQGWVKFTLICTFWPVLVLITPRETEEENQDAK
jgi:hypothetical protein